MGIGATGEQAHELLIDQSALTGESLPVSKFKDDIAFSSTIVKQGQQVAVVAKTGGNTFIGRAATLIAVTNEQGHFQKVVNVIGNFLVAITLVLVIILLIVLIVNQKLDALSAISQVLVLTIAAIPVGLPTVLSVTMAVGAQQLAKKSVIVKRLPAVEEMAGVTVLCSDKTGTLTLNKLSMTDPYLAPGKTYNDVLLAAYIASEPGANDAIELAVRQEAIAKASDLVGTDTNSSKVPNHTMTAFKPFDPSSKIVEATVRRDSDGAVFKVQPPPGVVTKYELNRSARAHPRSSFACAAAMRRLPSLSSTMPSAVFVASAWLAPRWTTSTSTSSLASLLSSTPRAQTRPPPSASATNTVSKSR